MQNLVYLLSTLAHNGNSQNQLPLNFGQAFAFDRTLLKNNDEAFAIQGYNYYVIIDSDGKIQKVQDLKFNTLTYPQTIQASSNYIFAKNLNNLYIYRSGNNYSNLKDIIGLADSISITNPFIQEIVTISSKSSARWIIGLGTLKFNGEQLLQLLHNIIQVVKLKYSIKQLKVIVKLQSLKINLFDELFEQFQLGKLISGSNLAYYITLPKTFPDFTVQLVQNREIQVTNWPKNPLYSTELVGNDGETLYQIFQTQDKMLKIQLCVSTDHIIYVCKDYGSFQLQETISEQLFSIWQDNDNIIRFITIQSLNKMIAFLAPDGVVIEGKSENFTEQILSILNQGSYLFVLQKNGLINSYFFGQDFNFINSVTGTQLIEFAGQWKPLKLHGNRILKSNILFVQNENNISIINYINREFIFIQSMDYTQNNQIYISDAKNTFFLVNNEEIFEYNYENLLSIYKSKTVGLYEYQIVNPLVVTSQLSTGNLVIKTTKAQNVYLNIYRASQTQHDIVIFKKYTNIYLSKKM